MIDRRWVGHRFAPRSFAIERGRLCFFAATIGETDPVYTSPAAAYAAGFRDLPAPPSFLFAAELEGDALIADLAAMAIPLTRVLHGEQGFVHHRVACAGEVLEVASRIADIEVRKGGALEIVRRETRLTGPAGEPVADLNLAIVVRHG